MPHVAMRDGDWTLLGWLPEKPKDQLIMDWLKGEGLERFELFNLRSDPEQRQDLLMAESAQAEEMIEQMRDFWAEIQADSPYWESWRMK
ncbi:hypothetical protein JYT20_01620 [Rhodothermus sp. AH-315-K08]|nr:hypothetical protein [Rhodothermus sp. AH-315-K08]